MAALAVVRNGPTLDDRLAEAQRAEIEPRRKVDELTAALEAAIEAKDYAKADKLQAQLGPAREALALAEVEARVLRESRQALDAQLAAERRELEERRQREEAQRVIGDAIAADQRAQELIDTCVSQMHEHLAAAKAAFLEAQTWEQKAGAEHRRMWQARVLAGEVASMPGRLPTPNKASVLADTTPLIRELVKWAGPPYRAPQQVVVAEGRGHGGRGLTRESPFR